MVDAWPLAIASSATDILSNIFSLNSKGVTVIETIFPVSSFHLGIVNLSCSLFDNDIFTSNNHSALDHSPKAS